MEQPKGSQKIRQGSIKLVTASGLPEIARPGTRFATAYIFFTYEMGRSSQIPITTTVLAWIMDLIVASPMIKKTALFQMNSMCHPVLLTVFQQMQKGKGLARCWNTSKA
jgi:hypothetical protein